VTAWVAVGCAIAALVVGLTVTADVDHERPLLFQDLFDGPDGIITNHYAYFAPPYEDVPRSPAWEVESGCALRDGNRLWSGAVDGVEPNKDCSNGAGADVFRMWTKRADFGDVAVSFGLRNEGYAPVGESWDGVKLYLRRQDGDNFYTAEANRREGNVIVQRKCDGRYTLLDGTRSAVTPAFEHEWDEVGGTVVNLPDDEVRIQVVRQGEVVLEAIDPAGTCDVLREPGRIGIRGDRTEFYVDGLDVRGLSAD
jgi:hypothetical protein